MGVGWLPEVVKHGYNSIVLGIFKISLRLLYCDDVQYSPETKCLSLLGQ